MTESKKERPSSEPSNQPITTVNKVLQRCSHLKSIIPPCDPQTTLHFDQYGGKIPQARKSEISESTIYEVLLGSTVYPQFSLQLSRLEELLCRYPEYCNKTFGSQLIDSFFSRFSELDVYDELKERGLKPDIEPMVIPGYKKSTKADFKINVNGVDIFIEVVTPRLPLDEDLEFAQKPKVGFYNIKKSGQDNVYKKIFHEYEHHFKVFEPRFNSPTFIILDKTYSIGRSDIFGSSDLKGIYKKYQFPDYFIGILDRTNYHIDLFTKLLNQPKTPRFYINPRYRDSMSLIPVLFQLFCHDKTDTDSANPT